MTEREEAHIRYYFHINNSFEYHLDYSHIFRIQSLKADSNTFYKMNQQRKNDNCQEDFKKFGQKWEERVRTYGKIIINKFLVNLLSF